MDEAVTALAPSRPSPGGRAGHCPLKTQSSRSWGGEAGSHEAVLDGSGLASGIYLVRLEAEGVVRASQKVLLLR